MPTPSVLAALLLATAMLTGACKKDNAKPGKTPSDAAAVAVTRPADAAPTQPTPPPSGGDAGATTPAGGSADAGAKSPGGDGDEKPTNLKVLPRTMTIKQVGAEMKKYAKELGVKCDFCHVKDDFASDKIDHKDMARKMIVMTRDLNKQFFDGKNEVTCFTCHQGQKEPAKD